MFNGYCADMCLPQTEIMETMGHTSSFDSVRAIGVIKGDLQVTSLIGGVRMIGVVRVLSGFCADMRIP